MSDATPDIHVGLLDLLLESVEPVDLESAAKRLGLPVSQIKIELSNLESVGCKLEFAAGRVALVQTGLGCWRDYLEKLCPLSGGAAAHNSNHKPKPRDVVIYESTTSTQDLARQRFESMGAAADGSVIVAGTQTAGRGRLGRSWTAPPGTGALFSLIHVSDPNSAASGLNIDRLVLVTAVAVALGIENACEPAGSPQDIAIKWPNDLMVGDKKLGGILVETVSSQSLSALGPVNAAIIGVGVNVGFNSEHLSSVPAEVAQRITSLALLDERLGRRVDRLAVLGKIIGQLDSALLQANLDPMLEQWRRRNTMMGSQIVLRSEGKEVRGQVLDLDPLEGLIVRSTSGEIVHLRAATTSVIA
jgi:BirA family biotin operon repressor/biotin-[acetyl-CoA-carboxylase] ligase